MTPPWATASSAEATACIRSSWLCHAIKKEGLFLRRRDVGSTKTSRSTMRKHSFTGSIISLEINVKFSGGKTASRSDLLGEAALIFTDCSRVTSFRIGIISHRKNHEEKTYWNRVVADDMLTSTCHIHSFTAPSAEQSISVSNQKVITIEVRQMFSNGDTSQKPHIARSISSCDLYFRSLFREMNLTRQVDITKRETGWKNCNF